MGENWPTHSPWWWDRFDELDAQGDAVADETERLIEEAEYEPRIDTYWDEMWENRVHRGPGA